MCLRCRTGRLEVAPADEDVLKDHVAAFLVESVVDDIFEGLELFFALRVFACLFLPVEKYLLQAVTRRADKARRDERVQCYAHEGE